MGQSQFIGANTTGGTFVGRRELQPTPGMVTWVNLANNPNYPQHVCGLTVASMGNTLYAKAITTGGTLFETTCDINGMNLNCANPWSQLQPTPTLLAAMAHKRNAKVEGPLSRSRLVITRRGW